MRLLIDQRLFILHPMLLLSPPPFKMIIVWYMCLLDDGGSLGTQNVNSSKAEEQLTQSESVKSM